MTQSTSAGGAALMTFYCLRRNAAGEYVMMPYLQLYPTMSVLYTGPRQK